MEESKEHRYGWEIRIAAGSYFGCFWVIREEVLGTMPDCSLRLPRWESYEAVRVNLHPQGKSLQLISKTDACFSAGRGQKMQQLLLTDTEHADLCSSESGACILHIQAKRWTSPVTALLSEKNADQGKDSSEERVVPNGIPWPGYFRTCYCCPCMEEKEYRIPVLTLEHHSSKGRLLSVIPALVFGFLMIVGMISEKEGDFSGYQRVSYLGIGMLGTGIMAVWDAVSTRRREKKEELWEKEALFKAEKELKKLRKEEWQVQKILYPETERNLQELAEWGAGIFERNRESESFLKLCIGRGAGVPKTKAFLSRESEPMELELTRKKVRAELIRSAMELKDEFSILPNAPVLWNLTEQSVLGMYGKWEDAVPFLSMLITEFIVRHSPGEVCLCLHLTKERRRQFYGLKGVPHLFSEKGDQRFLFESSGTDASSNNMGVSEVNNRFVLIISDEGSVGEMQIKEKTACLIWAPQKSLLPETCMSEIRLKKGEGTIRSTKYIEKDIAAFSFPVFPSSEYAKAWKRLDALRGIQTDGKTEKIASNSVSFYELYGFSGSLGVETERRWREGKKKALTGLGVAIGITGDGNPFFLDLSDENEAHGPHALIAGTTGSGKSEGLQTILLALALQFSPGECRFLLIDFKGGQMANVFRTLPHLGGILTNLEEAEKRRFLLSLNAELVKRQKMLSDYQVKSIQEYQALRLGKKEDGTSESEISAMPHLFLVVDEFAELKASAPEFMKELISAARIGRSLGIHLILSTQKPSSCVDAQIWSNAKFRLCFRVQDRQDSMEMLRDACAASLSTPGRAYFTVGEFGKPVEIQTAYSSGPVPERSGTRVWEISRMLENGQRKPLWKYGTGREQSPERQVDVLVRLLFRHAELSETGKLPPICMPPLPKLLDSRCGSGEILGLFDEPDRQRQVPWKNGMTGGNLLILGEDGSGKSQFLLTMADHADGAFYAVSCVGREIEILKEHPYCGGCVSADETERCRQLFRLLLNKAEQARIHGAREKITLFVDGLSSFAGCYPKEQEHFEMLLQEGNGLGITCVATAPSEHLLRMKTLNFFSERITLTGRKTPGRGIFRIETEQKEVQLAIPCATEGENRRLLWRRKRYECMKRSGEAGRKPELIPEVPAICVFPPAGRAGVKSMIHAGCIPERLPIGISFDTVAPVIQEFPTGGFFVTAGESAPRKKYVDFLEGLYFFSSPDGESIRILRKTQNSKNREPIIEELHITTSAEWNTLVRQMLKEKEQADEKIRNKTDAVQSLILFRAPSVFRQICREEEAGKLFAELVRTAGDCGLIFILDGVENTAATLRENPARKAIRDAAGILWFGRRKECRLAEGSSSDCSEESWNSADAWFYCKGGSVRIRTFSSEVRDAE